VTQVELACGEDIVATWVHSSGPTERLRRGLDAHARADAAQLAEIAERLGPSEAELVAATSADAWRHMRHLPACGALHGATTEAADDVRATVRSLGAELAALSAVDLPPVRVDCDQGLLEFPLSGVRLSAGNGEASVIVRDRCVCITGRDGTALVRLEPRDDMFPLVEVDSALPFTRPREALGVRVMTRARAIERFLEREKAALHDLMPPERGTLTEGLSLLSRADPGMLDDMIAASCVLATVRPFNPRTTRISWSHPRARGVIYVGVTDIKDTVDLIVHEQSHLKLFVLQDRYHLLERHSTPTLAPWRRDRRTAEGVVHGLYVFFQVARTFDAIFEVTEPTDRDLRRMAVWRVCLDAAREQLGIAGAELTPVGRLIVDTMCSDNSRALERLEPAHVSWARSAVARHLAQAGKEDSEEPWFLATA
jgi:HEXXH motif-containing protein